MILKSYEVENDISRVSKFCSILVYGENIGLKDTLKKRLVDLHKDAELISLYQEDISKNKDILSNEIKNVSLFTSKKIIIVNQANEKVIGDIENFIERKENVKIILFAELLDKRSKLRSLYEKKSMLAVVPCYNDNDITLKKLVQLELKNFDNLNNNMMNMILNYSNLNRKTILNNLEKIRIFFDKKVLQEESLETLLNSDKNELFENIRDAALNEEKTKLNNLLNDFVFTNEDTYLYLNMINIRLTRMLDILKKKTIQDSLEEAINKMKPPIFWKDRPIYIGLLKKWNKEKIIKAIKYLGKIEKEIKSNSSLSHLTLVKNSIINICTNSWSYF